ncbi:MAG: molybdopterin-dependent oxidoreductase [Gammaproteobacteria bacterium]
MTTALPPGQRERPDFPRFGLTPFAKRFPTQTEHIHISVSGLTEAVIEIGREQLDALERVEQTSDFHCVTTWSHLGLHWSGYRFKDIYDRLIAPAVIDPTQVKVLILKAQDGARTTLLLEDALADDVLLADQLNGEPLDVAHGGPVRLVAPSQYGYKSAKYLHKIELCPDDSTFRPAAFRFMDHPRGRVALEERGRIFPGWLLRRVYRPMIGPTVRLFARELTRFHANRGE